METDGNRWKLGQISLLRPTVLQPVERTTVQNNGHSRTACPRDRLLQWPLPIGVPCTWGPNGRVNSRWSNQKHPKHPAAQAKTVGRCAFALVCNLSLRMLCRRAARSASDLFELPDLTSRSSMS